MEQTGQRLSAVVLQTPSADTERGHCSTKQQICYFGQKDENLKNKVSYRKDDMGGKSYIIVITVAVEGHWNLVV